MPTPEQVIQAGYELWDAFTDWDWAYNEMLQTHSSEEIAKEKAARLEELRRKADAFRAVYKQVKQ